MVDMRIIWKKQLDLCREIAKDIIKNNASKEVCQYADKYAEIESPYGTRGGYNGNDFIRINYGESYCYIELGQDSKPNGIVWWNNEDMGIDDKNSYTYEKSVTSLYKMSLIEAYENCSYSDCYDEYEGREQFYILNYIPLNI